jgi:PTH1 family peptidyl-tRNA hydrolase
MMWVIVGLGNPGEEYAKTRHNVGRMVLETFVEKHGFTPWKYDMRSKSLLSDGYVSRTAATLVMPETFMNASGRAVGALVKSAKAGERLVIVYDELDMPLGTMKLSFDRGSAGHRGIESIVKAIKTTKFWRVRVGVSPATPSGKIKKPKGEDAVQDFILGKFKPSELLTLTPVLGRASEALECILTDGPVKAMNKFN